MILVAVHLTSEPLADQSYCGIIQVPYLLGCCRRFMVFRSRYLVIFMTMTGLAGFWEEKEVRVYNFFTNLH